MVPHGAAQGAFCRGSYCVGRALSCDNSRSCQGAVSVTGSVSKLTPKKD